MPSNRIPEICSNRFQLVSTYCEIVSCRLYAVIVPLLKFLVQNLFKNIFVSFSSKSLSSFSPMNIKVISRSSTLCKWVSIKSPNWLLKAFDRAPTIQAESSPPLWDQGPKTKWKPVSFSQWGQRQNSIPSSGGRLMLSWAPICYFVQRDGYASAPFIRFLAFDIQVSNRARDLILSERYHRKGILQRKQCFNVRGKN